MTKMWESFVSDFHNIKGVSVGERQRNFQNLLKNNTVPKSEQQILLRNLHPTSYSESLWYIDILIYFKDTAQLLEILKSGSDAFVGRILKQQWFFHEAFKDISAENLVCDYLPLMSFSVKAKLLKKLSLALSEEKLDDVFEFILQEYGLSLAAKVLTGCSVQKITSVLKINYVDLSTNQLKSLHIKEPGLVRIYFEEQQHNKAVFTNCFLKYLAQRNPILFWEIVDAADFKSNVKLGRRTTKSALNVKKDDVISKPAKYVKYLRRETLVRDLNKQGDFRLFFRNLFPKDVNGIRSKENVYINVLKYYPKHSCYRIYEETFNDVLKEDIWSRTCYIPDSFLPLIDDVSIREKWAEAKYKESNNDSFIQYYKMENCMAMVRKKISVTSNIKIRGQLFQILISACALNKDYESLEEVLKYYCARHRNDDKNARHAFLRQISSSENFNLEALHASHWKYVQELIVLQAVNKDFLGFYSLLRVRHIEYLVNNAHPEDEITHFIMEYLKDQVAGNPPYFQEVKKVKNAGTEKRILLQVLENLPNYIDDDKADSSVQTDLVDEIMAYNARNRRDKIDVYTNMSVNILKHWFQNRSYWRDSDKMFVTLVCKLNRNEMEEEVLQAYWEMALPKKCSNTVLKWYLKHDPLVIVENFNKIMEIFTSKRWSSLTANCLFRQIWVMMKFNSHLNLDSMVSKYALAALTSDETKRRYARQLYTALAVCNTTEEYINILRDFNLIPTAAKRAIEDGNEVFIQQNMYLAALKYVAKPLQYLPILIDKFCQGDYLQIAVPALYSAFYKSPEKELKPYIDKLSENKSISVRKHALSVSRCISHQSTIFEVLEHFEAESDTSLTKSMFLGILRYFSQNPSQLIFNKVVSYPRLLKDDDMESLQALTTMRIPKSYKAHYVESIWLLLEQFKLSAKEENLGKICLLLSAMLGLIDKTCMQGLSKSFCKEIIQHYAFNNGADRISSTLPFVVRFLMYSDTRVEDFGFVFQLLCKYKSDFWNRNSRKNERELVFEFFHVFYGKACEKEVKVDFIELFCDNWGRIFTAVDTFREYLLMKFLLFKKRADGDLEAYAKDIVLFSEKVIAQFGSIVLSKFVSVLSNLLGKEKHLILCNMLKFKTTSLNCILIMELIVSHSDLFSGDQIIKPYWDIHATLQTQLNDPTVRLHYNLYFKQ